MHIGPHVHNTDPHRPHAAIQAHLGHMGSFGPMAFTESYWMHMGPRQVYIAPIWAHTLAQVLLNTRSESFRVGRSLGFGSRIKEVGAFIHGFFVSSHD